MHISIATSKADLHDKALEDESIIGQGRTSLGSPSTAQSTSSDSAEELDDGVLTTLGQLIDASQQSCSALYECSCPELDELTQLCRDAGAYGSRLTGTFICSSAS